MSKAKHKLFKLYNEDNLDVLKQFPDNSIDSIVTDPPYGLSKQPNIREVLEHWLAGDDYTHKGKGFMGKSWDSFVPSPKLWAECLRVVKPGGHLLAFASTRTNDLMAMSIRLGGFELRDTLAWVYGSGFPKSHNIGKAVDKLQGNKRKTVDKSKRHGGDKNFTSFGESLEHNPKPDITKGNSPYEGWGTALKPALEPIILARKPLSEKTVAKNVLKWGTGGINIDGCRVGESKRVPASVSRGTEGHVLAGSADNSLRKETGEETGHNPNIGRFPANFIHDGSEEVVECFPDSKSGVVKAGTRQEFGDSVVYGTSTGDFSERKASSGNASRFFKSIKYCAKASKKDRNEGCDTIAESQSSWDGRNKEIENAYQRNKTVNSNSHPTVKPTELMQYLVRLITPKNGIVLDPFMGSGSTGKACMLEGFKFTGMELDEDYFEIAEARVSHAISKGDLFECAQ